jgi:hypothetical protein
MNRSSTANSASVSEILVPDDLSELDQWVLWRYEDRSGRVTKVPYQAGRARASSTDPGTWASFETIIHEWRSAPNWYEGPGFVFASRDPFCGIDLDDCLDAQETVKPWARGIVERFGDTYMEISPSGSGLKIWARGSVPGNLPVPAMAKSRYTNSGTGKTHIGLALGLAACQQGFRVRFTTAAALVHELIEARDETRLLRYQKHLSRQELLIVDELGFVPLSKTGAEMLFEVFSQRYERSSTLVTSNLPFAEWTEVLGSERLTGALLDRLTHHVHILEMNGESFRLQTSRKKKDSIPPPAH